MLDTHHNTFEHGTIRLRCEGFKNLAWRYHTKGTSTGKWLFQTYRSKDCERYPILVADLRMERSASTGIYSMIAYLSKQEDEKIITTSPLYSAIDGGKRKPIKSAARLKLHTRVSSAHYCLVQKSAPRYTTNFDYLLFAPSLHPPQPCSCATLICSLDDGQNG